MGEIAPDAGFRNYVPFEGSDKRRTPSYMQRHCIGLILQPVVRFTPENINYSASCTLSKRTLLCQDQKHDANHRPFKVLSSRYLRCHLTSSKIRIGGVAHVHRDTTAKNQVSAAKTSCAGRSLLISSGMAPPYNELRFTRHVGSFVKQYCVVLGLSRFTASPQPCISSVTGFTHAGSVRTDNF